MRHATVEEIARMVEKEFGITRNIITTKGVLTHKKSKTYDPSYLPHRAIAMVLCAKHTELTLLEVAESFGLKDDNSVTHARKLVGDLVFSKDKEFYHKIKVLEAQCSAMFNGVKKRRKLFKRDATVEEVARIVEKQFNIEHNIIEVKGIVHRRPSGRILYRPSYIQHRLIVMHFARKYVRGLYLRDLVKTFQLKSHAMALHASRFVEMMLDTNNREFATAIRRIDRICERKFIKPLNDKSP